MAELLKTGAIFLHVPKCGGTWVRQTLREQHIWRARIGFKHSCARHVNDILRHHGWQYLRHWVMHPLVTPGALRRAFKFCFVRNPLLWYESWWRFAGHRREVWERGRWHPQRPIDACGDADFSTFIENVLRERPGYVTEMYSWYTDGADFVGKCEQLAEDLIAAMKEAGITVNEDGIRQAPRVNVSQPTIAPPAWRSDLLERVVEAESAGIERYGYWRQVEQFCASRRERNLQIA